MFMSLDLIRRNINRVLSDNFLKDIGMNQNDFNNGQVIYLMAFLCAELPSGLISKKLGADIWVPTQMVAWGIVSACQSALQDRAGFFVTRAVLGLTEGGFLPDVILIPVLLVYEQGAQHSIELLLYRTWCQSDYRITYGRRNSRAERSSRPCRVEVSARVCPIYRKQKESN